MRHTFLILASFGILVVTGSWVHGADDDWGIQPANPAPPRSAEQFFTRGGSTSAAASRLTDPVSTEEKSEAEDASAGRQARSAKSGVINAGFERKTSSTKRDAELIHAEYRKGLGDRARVSQVRATAADSDDAASGPPAVSHRSSTLPETLVAKAPAPTAEKRGLDASQAPAISVQWTAKSTPSVGQECDCELHVKNVGKVAARDVTIDSYFPSTVRLTQAKPMPADNQDHVTWSLPILGAGEQKVIQVKLIPSKRGELVTTSRVRFSEVASNVFVVEEPLLHLEVHGPKELMVGDPATQSITISNPGTGIAHNVIIEARVTKGLEHPRGERLEIAVGSLNPGESRLIRMPLVAIGGGDQTVSVHATATGDLNRQITSKVHVIAPSVKVTVEGPSLRYVGRKATYVVTVVNDGGAVSSNVRVTHKLPQGFRFLRADHGGEYDDVARTVTWFLGRMEVKETAKLKVELATTQIGSYVHAVEAASEQGAHSSAKAETAVEGTAALEIEIVDQNDTVEVGTETAYEVHIRNDGSKAAENVIVTCEVRPEVQLLRAEGAASAHNDRGTIKFSPLPSLDPGKTAVYRVHVKGRREGDHPFRVRLTADSMKTPLVQDKMTKFYHE